MPTEKHSTSMRIDVEVWRQLGLFLNGTQGINPARKDAGKTTISYSEAIERAIMEFVEKGVWEDGSD